MGTGKRIWRTVYPLLLWFGTQTVIQYIYMFVKAFQYMSTLGVEALQSFDSEHFDEVMNYLLDATMKDALVITLVCNAVTVAVLVIFYAFDKKKWDKNNPLHQNSVKNPLQYVLNSSVAAGSCIGFNIIVSIIAAIAVSMFGEGVMESYDSVASAIESAPIWLQILTVVISAPVCEELLMRGLVYKRLRSFMKPVFSALISSAIFGLIHGNWVQFVYAFAVGFIAAYVYEFTRNLFAPILFHVVANGVSTLASTDALMPYFNTLMLGEGFVSITLTLCMTCIVTGLIAMYFISKSKLTKE